MADPKRILQKILGKETDLAAYEASGESLDLLVETLREVQRVRKFRTWLLEHTGLETALAPKAFHALLSIPEINYSETADRNLDVTQHSLKDAREENDPVSVAHLNTYLRELFRSLNELHQFKGKEYPTLHLAENMSGDLVDRVDHYVQSLRALDLRGVGFLLTGFKAKGIEKQFEQLFPNARKVHPLRKHMTPVQLELAFYRKCLAINIKWAATGLDLFRVFRQDEMRQTLQNVSEVGNSMWNVVYNGMQLPVTTQLAGIDFTDAQTLFDPEQVPLAIA